MRTTVTNVYIQGKDCKFNNMETTLQYLIRNYEQADNAYFDMQVKADDQSKVAEQAQNYKV